MDLAGDQVEGTPGLRGGERRDGVEEARSGPRSLGSPRSGDLVARQADGGELQIVPGQGEVGVVGIVGEARGEEGEVRGDARELSEHAARGREDGVAGSRRVLAGARRHLHEAALKGGRPRRHDAVRLAGRVGVDAVEGARREQDVAGDRQRSQGPDRAGGDRRPGLDDQPARPARSGEERPVADAHRRGEGAGQVERAGTDRRAARIGARPVSVRVPVPTFVTEVVEPPSAIMPA